MQLNSFCWHRCEPLFFCESGTHLLWQADVLAIFCECDFLLLGILHLPRIISQTASCIPGKLWIWGTLCSAASLVLCIGRGITNGSGINKQISSSFMWLMKILCWNLTIFVNPFCTSRVDYVGVPLQLGMLVYICVIFQFQCYVAQHPIMEKYHKPDATDFMWFWCRKHFHVIW